MKFSFLPALTESTAAMGTTCFLDFPTPAVTQVWTILDSFPGQLQHQMAQPLDSGDMILSFCKFCFNISVRWVVKHLQYPDALQWSMAATHPSGLCSGAHPFTAVHRVQRKEACSMFKKKKKKEWLTGQGTVGSAETDAAWWVRCFSSLSPPISA